MSARFLKIPTSHRRSNTNSSPALHQFFAVRGPYQRGGFGAPKQKDGKLIKVPMDFPWPDRSARKGDGSDGDEDSAPARAAEPQKPVIRDPVLARAVDLIKGLAIVRESRP
jgi:hypothetical protein